MIPICSNCDGPIEQTNLRHPGYCSLECRATDHTQRETLRRQARERRIGKSTRAHEPDAWSAR